MVKLYVGDFFEWFGSRKSGAFLILLVQSQVVDHFFVVCRFRGLILDSVEIYHLQLNELTLRLCGGSSATKLKVEEILEVVRQAVFPSRKKRKIIEVVDLLQ